MFEMCDSMLLLCIEMGGMFTVLKVREGITSYTDPGWYHNPPGTVAEQFPYP